MDFAMRCARILARKTGRGVYVGGSVGGFEEEVEEVGALRRVVEAVVGAVERRG